MAGETQTTIVGNLTADPELRFTQSGAAVASFTVASTPRRFDKATGEWVDGDPLFMRCNIWRQAAENATESFRKGDRVLVLGTLRQRSFETKEGDKRTVVELEVEEVGASVRFHPSRSQRPDRNGGQQAQQQRSTRPPADDPWGSAPPAYAGGGGATRASGGGWGGGSSGGGFADEPPF